MEWFNLQFKASPKQALALSYLMDNVTSELGYGGGAAWGKSYLWVVWLWMTAQKYPWVRLFIGRRELSNVIKTTLNTYYKFWQDYSIPLPLMGRLDKKYNIIKFLNGSEIMLLDCAFQPSDPLYSRFGSLELTQGFIDESNEVEFSAINILQTRIGRQKNQEYWLKAKLLETFNPDQWHVKERYRVPFKNKTLPPHRMFIPALVGDNPRVDPAYITQLENSDEITRQRLLFGNFDWASDEGKVFMFDEISDLFRNNIEKKSDITYISCDVARLGNDKAVIWVWKGMECIKIISYARCTIDDLGNKIKGLEDNYGVSRRNIVVDSDWVGGGLADILRWCTQFVNNASPIKFEQEKKWFVLKNFANLKTQCYFKLKEFLERRDIRVFADWEIKDHLSQELENIYIKTTDKDSKIAIEGKEELRKRINRSSDYADMVMMRMIYIVRELEQHQDTYTGVSEIDFDSILY